MRVHKLTYRRSLSVILSQKMTSCKFWKQYFFGTFLFAKITVSSPNNATARRRSLPAKDEAVCLSCELTDVDRNLTTAGMRTESSTAGARTCLHSPICEASARSRRNCISGHARESSCNCAAHTLQNTVKKNPQLYLSVACSRIKEYHSCSCSG